MSQKESIKKDTCEYKNAYTSQRKACSPFIKKSYSNSGAVKGTLNKVGGKMSCVKEIDNHCNGQEDYFSVDSFPNKELKRNRSEVRKRGNSFSSKSYCYPKVLSLNEYRHERSLGNLGSKE